MKRFTVFGGNYGSGKTELSLNTALKLKDKGSVALVDLDIVNPYFRSSESQKMLEENGIRLIKPPFANTTVDVPALSAEVYSAFNYDYAVFDAGGDPVGAHALGGLKAYFDENRDDTAFYYVVNARRPFQSDLNDAVEMLKQIESNARLKIDGLINNSNMSMETKVDDLTDGAVLCKQITEATGIPALYASGTPEVIEEYKKSGFKGDTIPLEIYTRPDWL